MNEELVDLLRRIRDRAWARSRCDDGFPTIERWAEDALTLLGVKDGDANPRAYGWWLTK